MKQNRVARHNAEKHSCSRKAFYRIINLGQCARKVMRIFDRFDRFICTMLRLGENFNIVVKGMVRVSDSVNGPGTTLGLLRTH